MDAWSTFRWEWHLTCSDCCNGNLNGNLTCNGNLNGNLSCNGNLNGNLSCNGNLNGNVTVTLSVTVSVTVTAAVSTTVTVVTVSVTSNWNRNWEYNGNRIRNCCACTCMSSLLGGRGPEGTRKALGGSPRGAQEGNKNSNRVLSIKWCIHTN